jgi:hypothetical protein
MLSRFAVLIVTPLFACATAGTSQGPSDGPKQGDGPTHGSDGTMMHPDGGIDTPPGSCATPFSGTLATWSFVGEPGSQAMTAATSMATGVAAGPASRSSALTVASGVGSINSSNWPTAATLDSTKYYTFSVTPPSGCVMDLTKLTIDVKSSGTGPAMAQAATSDDSFGATVTVSTTAASTPTLAVSGASGAIEVRVFGFSATGTGGTMRIQNTLSLQGALR